MNKKELLQNFKQYINDNNYTRGDIIYLTAKNFVESIDDIAKVNKTDVGDFLLARSGKLATFNSYKSHLYTFFVYCKEKGVIEKDPMEDMDFDDILRIRDKVNEKRKILAFEEYEQILKNLKSQEKIIHATLISSLFEGISLREISMVEKDNVIDNCVILKERNSYRFETKEYHAAILNEMKSTTRIKIENGGRYNYSMKELVDSKFLIRLTKRSKMVTETDQRLSQMEDNYARMKLGYSPTDILVSGFVHYVNMKVNNVEDLTESNIKDLLQRYNLTWVDTYDMLKGELF